MADHDDHASPDPKREALEARPLPRIYNGLSVAGCVLAAFGLGAIGFLFILPAVKPAPLAYASFTFLPAIAVTLLGLALIGAGLWRENWRRARGRTTRILGDWAIEVDLNPFKEKRRAGLVLLGIAVATFGVFTFGAATLRTVQYAESNDFCGTVCHDVMHPEAAVYQDSPHARIECAECHVGHVRGTFLRSKLNGLRQLVLFVSGNFNRPIPTPIRDQRPARELCEHCHWPSRFIGYREMTHSYFLGDEKNTPMKMRMMLKIGGGVPGPMKGSGIHYHMFLGAKVEYIAQDPQRQEIVWVRVTRSDGTVTEYEHAEYAPSDSERETMELRTMDCLDCHNRPAHQFRAPVDSVNQAIEIDEVSRELPFIKREAVRALDTDYATKTEALNGIEQGLRKFYQKKYPELFQERAQELEASILALQSIYARTIFPEMKAKWSAYPDNIGHLDWPGCFRCHNDEMESDEGDTIFTTCDRCHVILAQGEEVETEAIHLGDGLAFWHPEDEDYLEEYTPCVDCHMGGADLYE